MLQVLKDIYSKKVDCIEHSLHYCCCCYYYCYSLFLESVIENSAENWRSALGELSSTLRKDLSDRPSREEMFSSIRKELKAAAAPSDATAISRIDTELSTIKSKVRTKSRGLWFWTNQKITMDGFLLWDTEVLNTNTGRF